MDNIYGKLKEFGRVLANEPLKKHTTFKIGGPARFLVVVSEVDSLKKLLDFVSQNDVPFKIIGGGSNLLFSDEGFDGVVIKMNCRGVKVEGESIEAEAGALLGVVVATATQSSLSGFEWAVGIPGTVGGAVYGNAGAMGQNVGNNISSVAAWLDNEVVEMEKEACDFSYRHSAFKENGAVILSIKLSLEKKDNQSILSKVQEYAGARHKKFSTLPSAGSFFQNIQYDKYPGDKSLLPELFKERGMVPAGWLIDECDLRGFKVGDAGISEEHGNFLVNYGEATQSDVLKVVEEVGKKVYNKFGVDLIPEVQIVN